MAREDPHFRLRIPEDLRDRIAAKAEANKRSMTAEIIARLEASFEEEAITPDIEEIVQRTVLMALEMPEIRQAIHASEELEKHRLAVRKAAEEKTGKSWKQLEREHAEKTQGAPISEPVKARNPKRKIDLDQP